MSNVTNIMLTGVGGQGTVLAAKIIAYAAHAAGDTVRSAETIGMAQRGGSVVSHVRFSSSGMLASPLVPLAGADTIIAFEPAEALRVIDYLKLTGQLICARSGIQPVTAALSKTPYQPEGALQGLRAALEFAPEAQLTVIDDGAFAEEFGSRKALNVYLVASACARGALGVSRESLEDALRACVKPRFVEMNLSAVEAAFRRHSIE